MGEIEHGSSTLQKKKEKERIHFMKRKSRENASILFQGLARVMKYEIFR